MAVKWTKDARKNSFGKCSTCKNIVCPLRTRTVSACCVNADRL